MSTPLSFPLPPLPELENEELCQDIIQLDRYGRDAIQRFHTHYFKYHLQELQTHVSLLAKRCQQLITASQEKKSPEEIRQVLNKLLHWAESLRHEQLAKTQEARHSALKSLEHDLEILTQSVPEEKEIKIGLSQLQSAEKASNTQKLSRLGKRLKARLSGGSITVRVFYADLVNYFLRHELIRALEEILSDSNKQEQLIWEEVSDAFILLERYLRINLLERTTDADGLLKGITNHFEKAETLVHQHEVRTHQRLLYLFRLSSQKLAANLENPDGNKVIQKIQTQYNALEANLAIVIEFAKKWNKEIRPAVNTIYGQILLLRLQNRMKLETLAWKNQHKLHLTRWQVTLEQLSAGNYPMPDQMPGPASLQSQRQEIQLSLLEKIHKQPEKMLMYPALISKEDEDEEIEERFWRKPEPIQWTRTLSYIVENQLFNPLRSEAARHDEQLSYYRQQVLDALSLIVFIADNKEAAAKKGEALEENMQEVVKEGRKLLASLNTTAEETVATALQQAVNSLSYESVLEQAETLQREWQHVHGTRLRTQFQNFALKSGKKAQQALARLLYSGSEGWLLARQVLHQPPGGINLARILHLKSEICPRPSVWDKLPPLYKNLFLHSSVIGQDFWVNRKKELSAVEQAIEWHGEGQAGALIITGQPGMGKTALCRRALNKLATREPVYYVTPPRQGSVNIAVWQQALGEALGTEYLGDLALNRLKKNSVIVVSDLELWWERHPDGLTVLQELLRLIRHHGDRILFVFTVNTATLNLMEQLTDISEHALLILECQAINARQLQELILLRHRAGGLNLYWKDKPEDKVSAFLLARLFSQLFTYSLGNPGLSLTGWLAAIDRVEGKNIYIDQIEQPDLSPFEDLPPNWQMWLSQFVYHRNLSSERLQRLLPESSLPADIILGHLQRSGLITPIQPDVYQLQESLAPLVYRSLLNKGILTGSK